MKLFYYQIVNCQILLILGNTTDLASIFEDGIISKFPDIVLNDLSYGHNIIGNKVQLLCQTTLAADYVTIEWEIPKNVTQKTITQGENTNSVYVKTSTLVIEDAPRSGSYTCNVKVLFDNILYTNIRSKELPITLYDLKANVLEVDEDESFFNKGDVKVTIKFKAHPDNVTVTWIDHHGNVINNSSDTIISQLTPISNDKYNYKATLSFQFITEDDLGIYSVLIESGTQKYTNAIKIDFNEQEEIHLEVMSTGEEKMISNYRCKAAGNPKPTITWIFQPCNIFDFKKTKFSVEPLILNESYFEDRGLQIISYVSLNLSESGILKCVTKNGKVKDHAFYVKNGSDIFTNVSSQHGKVYLGYTQPVAVLCSHISYKYLNVYQVWYHNNINIINEGNSIYNLENPEANFLLKFVAQMSFDLHHEFQLGNYSCVMGTKSGKIESKTVEILFKSMPNLWPQIHLQDLNGGHTIVGQDIKLMCNITFHEHVQIVWKFIKTERNGFLEKSITPVPLKNNIDRRIKQQDIKTVNSNIHVTTSYLTISEIDTGGTGYYDCEMTVSKEFFREFIWVRIYDSKESHICFHENSKFDIQNLKIQIFLTAHPHPSIQWFDNNEKEIPLRSSNTSNFFISFQQILNKTKTDTNYEVSLSFKNLTLENFGNYTIVVKNEYEEANYSIEVNVTGVPSTKIYIDTFSKEKTVLKCNAIADPKPTIHWYFKKCTTLTSCLEFNDESKNNYLRINESWNETKGFQHISYISTNLSERGVLRCQSRNEFGEDFAHEPILGFENEFEIFANGINSNQTVELVGPAIQLNVTCATSSYNYTREFGVFYENRQLNILVDYPFVPPETIIEFHYLLSSFLIASVPVKSPGDSYYSCTVLNKNGSLKTRSLHFHNELASVTFNDTNMKNDTVYIDFGERLMLYCYIDGFPNSTVKWFKNNETIKFSINKRVLEIEYTMPDDGGTYMCEASNMYVKIVTCTTVHVVIKHGWLYAQILLLLLAFIFIAALVLIKFRSEKKLRTKSELVDLPNSGKSLLDRINPKLGIGKQADILPYNPKWEIPSDKIIIGKVLGTGAFGVTFEANVTDYFPDDPNRTVAIKTVNTLSGLDNIKALTSEIKIMSHLGLHVNIVNFLGACTKNVMRTEGELYMVLEFCSFGDILQYIRRRCESFVDQKDKNQDTFKWTKNENIFQTKDIITSKDLLLWSFQIARGMEYLGFRRIVHGDLAARNILLTDNNVVKVCDFGLAEHMYNYRNYVRKTQGRFPVKWMAVEAIERGIFSIQSDVWSFGVVLWEIFSLGKIPYADITYNQTFCKLLIDGYRMEKPEAATEDVYIFMLDCWNIDPSRRPSFAELGYKIGLLLDESVRNHYVMMNKTYMMMNEEQFNSGEDYLTMVLTPTYENIVSQVSESCTQEGDNAIYFTSLT